MLSACAPTGSELNPQTLSTRSASDQKLGDENHPRILQTYGGIYQNAKVTNYVEGIGRQISAVSEQPNAKWTFTVLDTPTVNAFALPGGYVYVTRGLIALANDEAELAGVIGHEIGHVTAGHSSLRQSRGSIAQGALLGGMLLGAIVGIDPGLLRAGAQLGQVAAGGVLANYSRSDEIAADNLGIRYLARSGYDPTAQADFLESMGETAALDARIAGRAYSANQVGFLASHPASGPRTRQAIQAAQRQGLNIPVGSQRNADEFFSVIDGIAYGQSPEQGFVKGNQFLHPKLRFAFTAPSGFKITNAANAVTAAGPNNTRFILDGSRNPSGSLPQYISGTWAPTIAKSYRVGQLGRLEQRRINGLEAASAVLPLQIQGNVFDALLVAIRLDGALYRLTGLAPRGSGVLPRLEAAAESFRRLSSSEARSLRGNSIDVVTVRRGDTVESLARRMKVSAAPLDRFRVLNGLEPGEQLKAGQKVKLIR